MSALPPKADMCSALAHVCYGPKADIAVNYSITSSARASTAGGTVRPSALVLLRLMINLTLVGACTDRHASAGADEVSTCHQPQDRQGVGSRRACASPADRRRGDRLNVGMSAFG